MLFTSEAVTRMGKIEDGNTISDWEPEEIKRTGSIQTSLVPCIWNNHKINLLDTPGYADFRGEVTSALRVADSALLVICLLYTSPSPRDQRGSRMPSSA